MLVFSRMVDSVNMRINMPPANYFLRAHEHTHKHTSLMATKNLTNPGATNIYLPREIKMKGRELAAAKGMSLSELIQRLIWAETKRKVGVSRGTQRG
jgi:hypothetical protein